MDFKQGVFVFAEQDQGKLAEVSLELICKARELADRLSAPVGAFVAGSGISALPQMLISYGADVVFVADDPRLKFFITLPYARLMVDLIRRQEPQIVLYGATPVGRELAPRIASELRAGLTADCTDLQIGDHQKPGSDVKYTNLLLQIRPAFGGNIIATIVSPDARPQMATVREGVMKMVPPDPNRKGEVIPLTPNISPDLLITEVVERAKVEKRVNLKAAKVIVSGGAGVGSKDNFALIRELAHVLGGEVGASRAAVDSGYIDRDHQVGQTGTTVRPKLYIACGISGAVQHRAGMAESSKIVAINTDPNAPIFGIAHYAIVGDLNDVLPKLIKAYKQK